MVHHDNWLWVFLWRLRAKMETARQKCNYTTEVATQSLMPRLILAMYFTYLGYPALSISCYSVTK